MSEYIYSGFIYGTLAEAEAARTRDHGGWEDGRRKCIREYADGQYTRDIL